MANEILSNIAVQLKDTTVSPNTYSNLENPSGGITVGQTAPLVRVTNFQDLSERYIAGLADGVEFSVECMATHASPSVQQEFIALNKLTRTLRIVNTDTSVSPNTIRYYEFQAVFLSWSLQPELGGPDKLNFTFKISGDITRSQG